MIMAPAIGPTLSGFIIEHYNWRALFEIILTIGSHRIVISHFQTKKYNTKQRTKLDVLSLVYRPLVLAVFYMDLVLQGPKGGMHQLSIVQ